MVSMAIASLFLPFLPLLATQILLNNFLSDVPAMGIAGDRVDRDWERTPHRWDMGLIRNFMITFGLVSTAFDLLTFGVLLYLVGGTAETFRTGWFTESLLTELCILFVLRTYRPFYRSRPAPYLLWSAVVVFVLTLALPYLPFAAAFDLVPLPTSAVAAILCIIVAYVAVSEATKARFFARFGFGRKGNARR
jgi:Mg2+-importing ATPase